MKRALVRDRLTGEVVGEVEARAVAPVARGAGRRAGTIVVPDGPGRCRGRRGRLALRVRGGGRRSGRAPSSCDGCPGRAGPARPDRGSCHHPGASPDGRGDPGRRGHRRPAAAHRGGDEDAERASIATGRHRRACRRRARRDRRARATSSWSSDERRAAARTVRSGRATTPPAIGGGRPSGRRPSDPPRSVGSASRPRPASRRGTSIRPPTSPASMRTATSGDRASTRSPGASSRRCTAAASGRCASTPASRPPRRRTGASGTSWSRARPASRSPSTCRPRWATTRTPGRRKGRSAGSACRSRAWPTWPCSSMACRSATSARR